MPSSSTVHWLYFPVLHKSCLTLPFISFALAMSSLDRNLFISAPSKLLTHSYLKKYTTPHHDCETVKEIPLLCYSSAFSGLWKTGKRMPAYSLSGFLKKLIFYPISLIFLHSYPCNAFISELLDNKLQTPCPFAPKYLSVSLLTIRILSYISTVLLSIQ